MKHRTRMLNKVLEFLTYRAVQRCFTWSAIFSSNTNVFPIVNIFIVVKIIGIFYNRTYMRKRPFSNIVLTVWFIKIIFSLFLLDSELSLAISIFFHYFLMKRSECIWSTSHDAWSSLRGLKLVRTGGFQPWNSREPIMTDSRNVVYSLERASYLHSDYNTEKKVKN